MVHIEQKVQKGLPVEPNTPFSTLRPGTGSAKSTCGEFRSVGHKADEGMIHGCTYAMRCHRFECPACWDQRNGWADRNRQRIEQGLLRGTPPGAAQEVSEFIVTPHVPIEMFTDPAYTLQVMTRFRRAFGDIVIPPGAWVRHAGPTDEDRCPQDPHFHVFIRVPESAVPKGAGFGEVSARFYGRNRIPGLEGVLKGVALLVPSSPGMKPVASLGWFGRRRVIRKEPLPEGVPAPEKTRHCGICHLEIPKREWRKVVYKPESAREGSWEAPEAGVELPNPVFYDRTSTSYIQRVEMEGTW